MLSVLRAACLPACSSLTPRCAAQQQAAYCVLGLASSLLHLVALLYHASRNRNMSQIAWLPLVSSRQCLPAVLFGGLLPCSLHASDYRFSTDPVFFLI